VHRLRQLRVVVPSSRIASCGRGRGSSTLGVPGKCADSADGGRHTECASRTLDQSVLEPKRAGTEQQVPATSRCELCRKLQCLESQPYSAVRYKRRAAVLTGDFVSARGLEYRATQRRCRKSNWQALNGGTAIGRDIAARSGGKRRMSGVMCTKSELEPRPRNEGRWRAESGTARRQWYGLRQWKQDGMVQGAL
jgi:hypothetical protein